MWNSDILSGPLFIGTAAVGLLINLMGVAMFYSGEGGDTDMNMRGVFVHFLADTLSSICVVTTALLLYYYETSYWVQHIDSISSLLIVVISFYLAFPLVRKCVYLVMQSTPIEIDTVQLEAALHKCDGDFTRIAHVGDLHVWSLNSNEHVASVSVGLRAHDPADAADACKWAPEIIERVKHVFAEHNVRQTCVQIELLPAQEPIAI
jgi:cobalt-zinc-cadmium efflux system protein